jgi:hypothetical protein
MATPVVHHSRSGGRHLAVSYPSGYARPTAKSGSRFRVLEIPHEANRKDLIRFSSYTHRARCDFNKIKQRRRVATPYDKLAANYLVFIKLASIRIWLRAESTLWSVPSESLPRTLSRVETGSR